MRTTRFLVLAAAVPLLVAVPSAGAAPKKPPAKKPPVKVPVCNLVKDPATDATGTGTAAPGPNEPTLDIVTADVASNATSVTVAIRLTSLDEANSTAPTGRAYTFSFRAGDRQISLRGLVGPAGTSWAKGDATGIEDKANRQVRMTIPISKLPVKIPAGAKITDLRATASRWVGTTDVTLGQADEAISTATYVAGWPSCVRVGA